jgi:uncharacterized protein YjbI with pentapeptide repeats
MGGANLTLANLDGAWLLAEQVTGVLGLPPDAEPADLTGAFMFNTVLDGAHCDGVNFTNAYFLTAPSLSASQSASAIGAYMNFATFNNTWLLRTVFDGAQLSASSFYLAHLIGASFQDYDGGATELTRASNDDHTRPSMIQADIRGANFTGANMDGLNMQDATYAVQPGTFSQTFTGYQNQQVTVAFNFNATVLGNTTGNTTCPNGTEGPCTLPPGASPRADKFAATPAPLP